MADRGRQQRTIREDRMFKLRFVLALVALLCMAGVASAEEVKTDHYTIAVPDDWKKAELTRAKGGANLILQSRVGMGVVSISIVPEKMDAKALAQGFVKGMSKRGFTFSGIVPVGDAYKTDFTLKDKQVPGVYYYSANGKFCCVIGIMGQDKAAIEDGIELLQKHLKPTDPSLFPSAY